MNVSVHQCNGIVKIKNNEKNTEMDTSQCDYLPTKEDILNDIEKEKNFIAECKNKDFSFNPFTPQYALCLVHHDATNEWPEHKFAILAKKVRSRVLSDSYNEDIIYKAEQQIELLKAKLDILHPNT